MELYLHFPCVVLWLVLGLLLLRLNMLFGIWHFCVQLQMALGSSSLVSDVWSSHRPVSWTCMAAGTAVKLVELASSSQEFISAKSKIQQTFSATMDRIERVQNPYLFGKYESCSMGRDVSVGVATRYGLDGPGIECR